MSTITLQDVRNDPAAFLTRLEAGEHLVILRGGEPVAEVRPLPALRPVGLAAGEFQVPDDFDAPLPDASQSFWVR